MRTAMLVSALLAATTALAAGCGDSQNASGGPGLSGSTPCEKADSLAGKVGCHAVTGCVIPASCADAANRWFECIVQDLSQCMCESDGDLNCEGSYKPNEGPARCIAEHTAFGECVDRCMSSCGDAGAAG
jgi:hypothetical protein